MCKKPFKCKPFPLQQLKSNFSLFWSCFQFFFREGGGLRNIKSLVKQIMVPLVMHLD